MREAWKLYVTDKQQTVSTNLHIRDFKDPPPFTFLTTLFVPFIATYIPYTIMNYKTKSPPPPPAAAAAAPIILPNMAI